ncbi:MAG: hypothetical protein WBY28_01575 [Nitrososphaeraceae archaeon]
MRRTILGLAFGIWHPFGLFLGIPIRFLSDLYVTGSMSVTTSNELGVTATCVCPKRIDGCPHWNLSFII